MSSPTTETAIAVYCGSFMGKHSAYAKAATSVGNALAKNNRRLVYGGTGKVPQGRYGMMGAVAYAAAQGGGRVTGVIPYAILRSGGEGDKSAQSKGLEPQVDDEYCQTIVVNSMHERKMEMITRSCGCMALPGGFGTFDEIFEVTTWTQLGIHDKPVVLLNVLNYYSPLRSMIQNGLSAGFIQPYNARIIIFVDGPEDPELHDDFDWGTEGIKAIDKWTKGEKTITTHDWSKSEAEGNLAAA